MIFFIMCVLLLPSVDLYRYLPDEDAIPNNNENSNNHQYVIKSSDRPFHTLIFYSTLYCSGTLISSRIVITVASCFMIRKKDQCFVKVGADYIQGLGETIRVQEIKIHEFFGRLSEIDNDIAMLILQKHVEFRAGVEKVLIVDPEIALRIGTVIEASGWASQNVYMKQAVSKMIASKMTMVDNKECRSVHGNLITNSNFCASYVPERRLSDSGGPVMFQDLLVGIVSYGANRKMDPQIAIITNVSYFHRWIALNANFFLNKYCKQPKGYETNLEE